MPVFRLTKEMIFPPPELAEPDGLLAAGGDRAATDTRRALEELIQAYWFPLYAFVRRQGESPAAAEDLVQEFFARLLEKKYLSQVDPSKGKFRSFLLAAVKQHPCPGSRSISHLMGIFFCLAEEPDCH